MSDTDAGKTCPIYEKSAWKSGCREFKSQCETRELWNSDSVKLAKSWLERILGWLDMCHAYNYGETVKLLHTVFYFGSDVVWWTKHAFSKTRKRLYTFCVGTSSSWEPSRVPKVIVTYKQGVICFSVTSSNVKRLKCGVKISFEKPITLTLAARDHTWW